jgi:signal transduction histidine kinase
MDFVANIIDLFLIAFFTIKWLQVKNDSRRIFVYVLFTVTPAVITFILSSILGLSSLTLVIYLAANFVLSVILLNGSNFEKFLVSLIGAVLYILTNFIVVSLAEMLSASAESDLIGGRGIGHYLLLFFAKLLYLIIAELILSIKKKTRIKLKISEWIVIICLFSSSLIAEIYLLNSTELTNTIAPDLMIYAANILVIDILTLYLFISLNLKNEKERSLSLLRFSESAQSQYLEKMKNHTLEMKKIRHDIMKYLDITAELVESGKSEKALSYIKELQEKFSSSNYHLVTTASDILSATLNLKYSECLDKNIKCTYQIVGDICGIKDTDISIMLYNLLENAIEACEGQESPFIDVKICDNKAYVMILIRNSLKDNGVEINDTHTTTKTDKEMHGFGLLTVSDIVKTYNGLMNISRDENIFIADIRLRKIDT